MILASRAASARSACSSVPSDRGSVRPGISRRAGQIRARRLAGAHHVSVPAASRPWPRRPRASCTPPPLRHSGRLAGLFNICFGALRVWRWLLVRTAAWQPCAAWRSAWCSAASAQLVFQLPGVWRAGFSWRPRWNLRHEGVRQILGLMGPALIGSASGQINVLVNTNFAAGLRDASGHVMNGPVSWLAYAYRFFVLPWDVRHRHRIGGAAAPLPQRRASELRRIPRRLFPDRS